MHLQNSIKDFPSPAEFVDFIKGVKCPTGSYRVDELIQMNGDSVQLYICTVVRDQLDEQEVAVVDDDKEAEPNIDKEGVDIVDEDEEEPATEETVEERPPRTQPLSK
jgi:hypothetical protein